MYKLGSLFRVHLGHKGMNFLFKFQNLHPYDYLFVVIQKTVMTTD